MKIKNITVGPIRLVADEPKYGLDNIVLGKDKSHTFKGGKEQASFYARSINSQYSLGHLEVDGKKKKKPESADGRKVKTPGSKSSEKSGSKSYDKQISDAEAQKAKEQAEAEEAAEAKAAAEKAKKK